MSILLIAAPDMEEFMIEAADQEAFALDTKTLFFKIHETSHNGFFQDNGHKWTINDIVRLLNPIGLRRVTIARKSFN